MTSKQWGKAKLSVDGPLIAHSRSRVPSSIWNRCSPSASNACWTA
ncbi:hypothetical protein [Nonomuraea gerenzanensis]|nr:hypothetical protein [Nonomuraea gerenzanensis]